MIYPVALTSMPVKANILIDKTGNARLAYFGLLTILSDPSSRLSSSSYTHGGTARWMSPELITPQRFRLETGRRTKSPDCYALGIVIYETIAEHLPFRKHADLIVLMKVSEGKRPVREAWFTDDPWEMLAPCWAPQPSTPPDDVLQCLEDIPGLPRPLSFVADEEVAESDNWPQPGIFRYVLPLPPLRRFLISMRFVAIEIPMFGGGDPFMAASLHTSVSGKTKRVTTRLSDDGEARSRTGENTVLGRSRLQRPWRNGRVPPVIDILEISRRISSVITAS